MHHQYLKKDLFSDGHCYAISAAQKVLRLDFFQIFVQMLKVLLWQYSE